MVFGGMTLRTMETCSFVSYKLDSEKIEDYYYRYFYIGNSQLFGGISKKENI